MYIRSIYLRENCFGQRARKALLKVVEKIAMSANEGSQNPAEIVQICEFYQRTPDR